MEQLTSYNCLYRTASNTNEHSQERNEEMLEQILNLRDDLYRMIERLPNYKELVDDNGRYNTTGNIYNALGIKGFNNKEIEKQAIKYERSKDKYFNENITFIMSFIKADNEQEYLDLFQEASINFIKSFNTYDKFSGNTFSTFSGSYIKCGCIDAKKKISIIHINDNFMYYINQVKAVRASNPSHNFTNNELYDLLPEISKDKIDKAVEMSREVESLNRVVKNDGEGGTELLNILSDCDYEDSVTRELTLEKFRDFMRDLLKNYKYFSDREREILTMRFSIGLAEEYTLEEVGKQFGITRERVRQIESKSLKLISKTYKKELSEFYEAL